jgi:hypothetical protein
MTAQEKYDAGAELSAADIRKDSGSTAGSFTQEFRQLVPLGLRVGTTVYGFGIFATTFFPKDSVVYQGKQIVIPDKFAEFRLILENQEPSEFSLNTETHSVKFTETERWLYLFDSFMNHSCNPSTISRQSYEFKAQNIYETVALRDIHPGDEITCDYNLFEYDCEGKIIEKCLCNSANCVGRVAGFRYLSRDEQRARIQNVDREVLESMTADGSNKFLYISDLRCPMDIVRIETTASSRHGSYRIVAARDFKCGEVLYRIDPLVFIDDRSLVIEIYGERKWVDKLIHTVNLGNGTRWFSYFDSFQNHSCDPNTEQIYVDANSFHMRATRDIKSGEELTCDYESFDEGYDGTSFICKCGSKNCRGVVKA